MSVFYEREEEEKMTIENISSAKTFAEDLTFYNEVINNIDLFKSYPFIIANPMVKTIITIHVVILL